MLKCSGAIGHELAIRLEVVEGPRHGFVGGKFTIGNSLVDAAMKSKNKRFVVRVEKDFVFEVSSEEIFTEEETRYLHTQLDQPSGVFKRDQVTHCHQTFAIKSLNISSTAPSNVS